MMVYCPESGATLFDDLVSDAQVAGSLVRRRCAYHFDQAGFQEGGVKVVVRARGLSVGRLTVDSIRNHLISLERVTDVSKLHPTC